MLHVDAALAVLALASQVAVAAGHGRRAQAWSGAQGHLWGSCGAGWGNPGDDPYAWGNLEAENVYGNVTSCTLSDATCSDRLSDGPSDADIELVLGNLPPSTSEQDVHLHWWAARKSMSSYDPLISPHGCAIYDHMGKAYPKYWEEDFNGGNVRVNESGVAVIRFRSPATYLVKPYISWPHVHFRVCEGTASAQFYYDSLVIAERLWMNTKSQDSEITVISAVPFAAANAQSNRSAESSSSAADRPIGVLVYRPPTPSSPAGASTFTSTGTTTTAATTAAPELEPFVIQEAKEKLQLDALEFSPVYECLLDDSVFDHFSGECVNDCPQNAELHQGQCVLPAQDGVEEARFRASWRLEVRCADLCGKSMENETLHNIRLSVAGHLDVPFQEVERAAFSWLLSTSRRLSTTRKLFLTVQVKTKRLDQETGLDSLHGFLDSTRELSQLMGMEVHAVTALPQDIASPSGTSWELTSDSDPYNLAYQALMKGVDKNRSSTESGESSLTELVIAVIAAAAVACGCASGAFVWFLHQRARRKQSEEQVVLGKVAQEDDAAWGAEDPPQTPKLAWQPTG